MTSCDPKPPAWRRGVAAGWLATALLAALLAALPAERAAAAAAAFAGDGKRIYVLPERSPGTFLRAVDLERREVSQIDLADALGDEMLLGVATPPAPGQGVLCLTWTKLLAFDPATEELTAVATAPEGKQFSDVASDPPTKIVILTAEEESGTGDGSRLMIMTGGGPLRDLRFEPGSRATGFVGAGDGNWLFCAGGDVWHGAVGNPEPDGEGLSLFGYRYAPLATPAADPALAHFYGLEVTQLVATAHHVYAELRRDRRHGPTVAGVVRLPRPAPLPAKVTFDDFDTRWGVAERAAITVKALAGLEELGGDTTGAYLCGSADRRLVFWVWMGEDAQGFFLARDAKQPAKFQFKTGRIE